MRRSRDRRAVYAGLHITVRWKERRQGDTWGPGSRRFSSSYLIAAIGAEFGTWKHMPYEFGAYDDAAAYALAEAKRTIEAYWSA